MGEWLGSWITGLTAAAILAAGAEVLTPPGGVAKVTRFVCGIMMSAVLFSPLLEADAEVFSHSLAGYRQRVAELTEELEEQQKRMSRTYIEERCGAYILDEAQVLGIQSAGAEVKARWGDEYWVPYEVRLTGAATQEQRLRLGGRIAAQLGIPEERQRWE